MPVANIAWLAVIGTWLAASCFPGLRRDCRQRYRYGQDRSDGRRP